MNQRSYTEDFADRIDQEKYRLPGESHEQRCERIANGLFPKQKETADCHNFLYTLLNRRFLPAGRIQAAIGAPKQVTPFNCFVAPTIMDSFVEGDDSIMEVARKAATTMRMGGGIGYDFSTLRPRNAEIIKLASKSSGPVAFMHIFDAICRATSSAGNRRGAQMGVLRIDHPDIEEFIDAKVPTKELLPILDRYMSAKPGTPEKASWYATLQASMQLTGFNVSVGVTDEFMQNLANGKPHNLQWNGRIVKTVDSTELWERIMRNTWDWAEPGVLFIDTINRMNNLWYCETIAATNPCGEQPLPPNGACLLGSFNLTGYIVDEDRRKTYSGRRFNMDQLLHDVNVVVDAMDRVIDVATYPTPEQRQEAIAKRRMGLGVTGLANAAEALGYVYGSADFLSFTRSVLENIQRSAYTASANLARERGSFFEFDKDKYLEGYFIQTLPVDVRYSIKAHGIRNSHLLSIAPTGTISLAAGNVSSGIEPVMYHTSSRKVNVEGGQVEVSLEDYGYRVFSIRGKLSEHVTAKEHVKVLSTCQEYVDSSVSKTCTVSPKMPWEEFKDIYVSAWEKGCKGCTTFNPGGKRAGIITKDDEEPKIGEACSIDPKTGQKSCG